MEGVNHVHIIQISSGSLIGNVHRMFQRQVPHRESLELGITSTNATFVLAVELAQANRHLATTRTWSRHDDQRTGGLHVVVLAETIVRSNQFHIVRIPINEIMTIGLDAHTFETMAELVSSTLTVIVSDDHRAHIEAATHKLITQTQGIFIVCDAKVSPHLVLFNVFSTNHNHNLQAVPQLGKHT